MPQPAVADGFAERLSRRMRPARGGSAGLPAEDEPRGATSLTPGMLRAALLAMGEAADPANLALAEAFAQLGLALTGQSLSEAHAALARAPGATPLAFALARALALPVTPAALKALSTVTQGLPPERLLPAEMLEWLGLAVDAGSGSKTLAAQLALLGQQIGRSTENRVSAISDDSAGAPVQDVRTVLLSLAQGAGDRTVRQGADALAAHVEGQQLIQQAARHSSSDVPLYFAVPVQFSGEQTMVEMRLQSREQNEDEDAPEEIACLRATVRVATKRLGRIQAELTGTLTGLLTCRIGAERPATARLLQRSAGDLAEALAAMGWRACEVCCHTQSAFPPLWFGGDALTRPRARVDWRA